MHVSHFCGFFFLSALNPRLLALQNFTCNGSSDERWWPSNPDTFVRGLYWGFQFIFPSAYFNLIWTGYWAYIASDQPHHLTIVRDSRTVRTILFLDGANLFLVPGSSNLISPKTAISGDTVIPTHLTP